MKTKINMLYDLFKENPSLDSDEAEQLLGITNGQFRKIKWQLKEAGYIRPEDDGTVTVLKPYEGRGASPLSSSYKSQVYGEMVEAYLEDFRGQSTFNDRLAVGREIRLLLEKI